MRRVGFPDFKPRGLKAVIGNHPLICITSLVVDFDCTVSRRVCRAHMLRRFKTRSVRLEV